MTVAEYRQTPETVRPQELTFGAVRVADAPAVVHQTAVAALFLALHEHVASRGLGSVWFAPLDVILNTERALIVQPDLVFVAGDRSTIVEDKVVGAPDLVVEVLSPNPRIGELGERIGWFASYGVRECWLVHYFERRIEVLIFQDGRVASRRAFTAGDSIKSNLLPQFDRAVQSILGY